MTQFDYKRFAKKTGYRLLGKLIDMAILIGVGSLFGLHLVRGF